MIFKNKEFIKSNWNWTTHAGAVGDTNDDDVPPSVQDAINKMASGAPCMQILCC